MAKILDIKKDKAGAYSATQKGVLFPDGTIVWGDPNDQNRVEISLLNESRSSGVFMLDRTDHVDGDKYSVASLRSAYVTKLERVKAGPGFEGHPRIVTRQLMLAIGELEVLED